MRYCKFGGLKWKLENFEGDYVELIRRPIDFGVMKEILEEKFRMFMHPKKLYLGENLIEMYRAGAGGLPMKGRR
jgi:hypothetical protein